MAYGRREIAPAEQIRALRHARDQYVQLAERIHGDTESISDPTERQLREDDARRIAKAYDRSLSNSVDRLSRMEGTHGTTSQSYGRWIGIILILALACLLPFAYQYQSTLSAFLNMGEIRTIAFNSAPAKKAPPAEIPPPVLAEQSPPPENPEPPKNLEVAVQKPAATTPAPEKIAPPPAQAAKKPVVQPREAKRETTPAKPAAPKPVVQMAPDVATAATPVPAEPPPPAPPAPASAPLSAPVAPPAPPVAPAAAPPAAFHPESIAETHTLPKYPPFSARVGEAGTTKMSVALTPQGRATDCRIVQSSGSDRLDRVACAHVTDQWRWKPASRDSSAPLPRTFVTIVWKLPKPTPVR